MLRPTIAFAKVLTFVGAFLFVINSASADWPQWIADPAVQPVSWTAPADVASDTKAKQQTEKTVAEKAAAERLARNEDRLARLRKPLADVRIEATSGDRKTPASTASELFGDQLELTISSSGAAIPRPNRYPLAFYHRPLYYEELNLERCGNTCGCATNVVSGIHFVTNTAMLPYRIATQRPDCPVKSHGDCQTCQAFPYDIEPFGFEPRGVLVETAVAAGFVFLLM